MRRMLIGAAALALALAAASAFAQGPGYGPDMMGGYGPGAGRGLAALNLTDDQQDKIFAIQEQQRTKNFGTMTKLRSEAFKLQRMANADNPDSKAVVEQQKKVDDLRREMLAARLEARKEVQKVLTPEQRKQFRQFGPWWAPQEGE